MRIRTIAIGLIVLIAVSSWAVAQGPNRPVMDAKIEIGDDTVSYMFFSEENVDEWEMTVTWREGNRDGTGYIELSETYYGNIVYKNGNSPAYNVQFVPGTATDAGGLVTSMPITIKADGDLLYPVTATATADGETITTETGILDLNPVEEP